LILSFEGTAETESSPGGMAERDYEFKVEKVLSGNVQSEETVRVLTSEGASCGISQQLLTKARYRMSAYISAMPEGKRLLFVTLCGGSAELLAPPPALPTASTDQNVASPSTRASPSTTEGRNEPSRWLMLGGGSVLAAIAGLVLRRRGRA
jgi:LPXTG-motif cell wall-anchored protein